jgi:Mrp family chromosome partitioning ATPase
MQMLHDNFHFLRARVQGGTSMPTVIAVGSALPGDGKTYVACGLAQAFAEAGHETLLLDANPRNPSIANELGISVGAKVDPTKVREKLFVASLFDREVRVLRDNELDDLVEHLRARYAVTIVDGAAIPGCGSALQIARIADALLVAVRLGRRREAADDELKLLMDDGAPLGDKTVSGVVPTRAQRRRLATTSEPELLTRPLLDSIGRRVSNGVPTVAR